MRLACFVPGTRRRSVVCLGRSMGEVAIGSLAARADYIRLLFAVSRIIFRLSFACSERTRFRLEIATDSAGFRWAARRYTGLDHLWRPSRARSRNFDRRRRFRQPERPEERSRFRRLAGLHRPARRPGSHRTRHRLLESGDCELGAGRRARAALRHPQGTGRSRAGHSINRGPAGAHANPSPFPDPAEPRQRSTAGSRTRGASLFAEAVSPARFSGEGERTTRRGRRHRGAHPQHRRVQHGEARSAAIRSPRATAAAARCSPAAKTTR